MDIPTSIKIFHILHIDRLNSVLSDRFLYSYSYIRKFKKNGTTIGIADIKINRLFKKLSKYPQIAVGDCTPFYFCPRSVMLYMIYKGNYPEIPYKGGQAPILHIVADFYRTIEWTNSNNKHWVFTPTNAAASYTEDFNDVNMLSKINWDIVHSNNWKKHREQKQAEFLIENSFPIELIEKIGVYSEEYAEKVQKILSQFNININIEVRPDWYY